MAVIINDLEVVLEPPSPAPDTSGPAQPPPQQQHFTPQDYLTLLDRERRNHLRLRAH